jgi:heme-degrading monooxygenase HmoA
MQDFYFIVAFAIPVGEEPTFRRQFTAIASKLRDAPGGGGGSGTLYEVAFEVEKQLSQVPGIGAALQNRPDSRASFGFLLLAHWESLAQYRAVIEATAGNPPLTFPAFPAYYRLAAQYQSALGAATGAELTFISPFEVPADEHQDFVAQWRATIERLHEAPGFLSARLYEVDDGVEADLKEIPRLAAAFQSRAHGKARFRFIWVSQWATVAQYETAVRTFGRGTPLPFPSHPAFYQAATT